MMDKIDALIAPGRFPPRWGFHDDHRDADGTPAYLPALQQVRSEFAALVDVLQQHNLLSGKCLQLGIGESQASHAVWMALFSGGVVTIDWSSILVNWVVETPGGDTHDARTQAFAWQEGPYDFLFIDAGHGFDDVLRDHLDYGPLVKSGGIIAFHDSLPRAGYEEVEVWRYLETLGDRVTQIGSEVGTAWIVQQ